ncbi:Oidioi.mRNA.OKI2018_I69.PAR.g11112.t1.cds [Oikopleura dioica]|uniref:Oidioi.mRNA.OKI2018_I69.PAR.g11112.t1.cds n=1 Tax=Oikopleura dioica TaxID=34765 RepID=A0ABN7RUF4_OIKDI|nr:Oidioi.mRNA.OKI2018_I69.PAR.g11112.t1.cds [Oikopleura dioica]
MHDKFRIELSNPELDSHLLYEFVCIDCASPDNKNKTIKETAIYRCPANGCESKLTEELFLTNACCTEATKKHILDNILARKESAKREFDDALEVARAKKRKYDDFVAAEKKCIESFKKPVNLELNDDAIDQRMICCVCRERYNDVTRERGNLKLPPVRKNERAPFRALSS